jgi:hypothetical protein
LITGWLLKIVVVIALVGLVVVEVGSPVITHFQVDGAAHDAANDAAADYVQRHDVDGAKSIAEQDAAKEHATLDAFAVDDNNIVHVRLSKQAKSFLLKKLSVAKKWYDVSVSASSSGPTGK